jgi:lysophospholipase L1-like esterase
MKRRKFLRDSSLLTAAALPITVRASAAAPALEKPKDYRQEPFRRMVILGESTVEGGPWLQVLPDDRYADVLRRLINSCQQRPVEYFNRGIGANAISPRSPGYAGSRKPSAMERYQRDVIELKPDLFILAYGLNDMRAGMPLADFREDMATILRDVKQTCAPMIVLTTIYYMNGWKSYPPYDKGSIELTLKYNDCIRDLAREFDCVVADPWGAEGGADWVINPDGVHANKVGNLLIAHRIFEAIAQHASGLSAWTNELDSTTKWVANTTKTRAGNGDPYRKTW